MGSTIQAAIVIPTVVILLCFLVIFPLQIIRTEHRDYLDGLDEIGTRDDYGLTCEQIDTFISGICDNYRIMWGGIGDALDGEEG